MARIKEDVAKILILGDSRVGKSSILSRYCDGTFTEIMTTTIGTDYRVKRMKLMDEKEIKMQIWDTAGQERFRCITKNFYRDSHGLLIVFDLNDSESFKNVETWLRNLDQELGNEVEIVRYLVGNKADLPRTVKYEDANALSTKYGIPYYETSAKTGTKIEEMFSALAKEIYVKVIKSRKDSFLETDNRQGRHTLTKNPDKPPKEEPKEGGCCK
eukprot:CAMPEP_0176416820 /NCGR_PEP_ID=MMETSP0127-20121128/6550_1 /TAXON_ID=938130 /ORGANISM="Platyophrya macrostoma, Strain WH" /LENGTH=213 /DNA_ID=CAMNT_0017796921 /DNA_START=33 /DNA_END=674 /DNA_ORIENTATION=-